MSKTRGKSVIRERVRKVTGPSDDLAKIRRMIDAGESRKKVLVAIRNWAKQFLAEDSDVKAQIFDNELDILPWEILKIKLQVLAELAEKEVKRSR